MLVPSPALTAMPGTPRRLAVRAAPTVPETVVMSPRFWPRFVPETTTWGGDFRQVSTHAKPLPAGQSESLVMKSDTRYYSNGSTEGMFAHKEWKDATVELFVRVGRSRWTKFGEMVDVERHIGAHSVQDAAASPSPAGSPSASPSPSPGAR